MGQARAALHVRPSAFGPFGRVPRAAALLPCYPPLASRKQRGVGHVRRTYIYFLSLSGLELAHESASVAKGKHEIVQCDARQTKERAHQFSSMLPRYTRIPLALAAEVCRAYRTISVVDRMHAHIHAFSISLPLPLAISVACSARRWRSGVECTVCRARVKGRERERRSEADRHSAADG